MGIDIKDTGVTRMPLYAARPFIEQFNKDAQNYPCWIIKTSKWYDPEGLSIDIRDYTIQYAGTVEECKRKLQEIIDGAKNDNDYQHIEEQTDESVRIYYPRAIAKATFSILYNQKGDN